MRILKGGFVFSVLGEYSTLGGESQRGCSFSFGAISAKAQCTGKWRSYLEPNSGSMQKPIEGRGRIGAERNQNHAETAVYLEPNRNGMHVPIEGRSRHLQNSSASFLNPPKPAHHH